MKKLMIAASAALCATVGLCVESANIVGYQTPDVLSNVALGINTFNPVSGSTVDIQSIKVAGEGLAGGQVQIQTMTAGGTTDRTFAWITADEAGDYDMEGEGWYDADEGVAAEMTFEIGEGFVTMNDFGEGATVTYAGAVPMGATEIPLAPNVSLAGNSTPVSLDIQSIVCSGEGLAGGQIQIQTMTSGGTTDRTFAWITADEAVDYDMEGEGWYDADEGVTAEMTFAPGAGFVVMNDYGEGATMTLPSPL